MRMWAGKSRASSDPDVGLLKPQLIWRRLSNTSISRIPQRPNAAPTKSSKVWRRWHRSLNKDAQEELRVPASCVFASSLCWRVPSEGRGGGNCAGAAWGAALAVRSLAAGLAIFERIKKRSPLASPRPPLRRTQGWAAFVFVVAARSKPGPPADHFQTVRCE